MGRAGALCGTKRLGWGDNASTGSRSHRHTLPATLPSDGAGLGTHLSLGLQPAKQADLINPGSPAGLVCQSSGQQDGDEGRQGQGNG